LLGPSGCGKTTSLRMIAGFEVPDTGRVLLRDKDVSGDLPSKRNVNMVFQHYALFPHMNVEENVMFGLRVSGVRKKERVARVAEILEIVRLPGYQKRKPWQLSGGQQQRVALARALVNRPSALLLDEPLGALDVKLRREMQLELKAIQHELGITALYVTHDQEEALALADQVMVMNNGGVEQIGSPQDIWSRPGNEFTARFLGFNNLFRPQEARHLGWPAPEGPADGYVVYRADGFGIDPGGPFEGVVRSRTYRGDHFLIKLASADDVSLEVVVRWQPVPAVNDELRLGIDPSAVLTVHP